MRHLSRRRLGAGKPMRRRFREKLRKERRTIRIHATDGDSGREKIDAGNLFRCWHCGFICDIRRDDLSDSGRHGSTSQVYETTTSAFPYQRGTGVYLNAGIGVNAVLMKLDAASDTATIYHHRTVSVSGCPFCGARNWKA